MLLDDLMREDARGIILEEDLFGLHAGEFLDALVDISRDKILIASISFSECLFNERHPKLVNVSASAEDRLSCMSITRNALVYENIDPCKVNEDSDDVEANRSELVENRRIHTIAKK